LGTIHQPEGEKAALAARNQWEDRCPRKKPSSAIGLSKARRAGVKLRPPKKGATSKKTRKSAESAYRKGQSGSKKKPSRRRSRAVKGALGREEGRKDSRPAEVTAAAR